MAWSTESAATNVYDVQEDSGTEWDGGATVWDVVEQVITTDWDLVELTTTWSAESGI